MDNMKKIPLAERVRGVIPNRVSLPLAMGVCAIDFFEIVGEFTGQEERYKEIYQKHIAPHVQTTDTDKPKCVCKLVMAADELQPKEREDMLFWLLAEPFAAMASKERSET